MRTICGEDATEEMMRWAENNQSKVSGKKIPQKPRNPLNVLQQFNQETPATSVTDESSSLNHVDGDAQDIINGKRSSGYVKLGNFVKIDLNSLTKSDARGLKRKLECELNQIRSFRKKLESSEYLGKDRTPKAIQCNKKSKFVSGKEKSMVRDSNKKLKSNGRKNNEGGIGGNKFPSEMHKRCSNLLGRVMKHKFSWVFNTPVDVKKLGLRDYYTIVKHPMDLGTVKSRLSKNMYKSPRDFADDVRLTFTNAMLYNPKEQDAHKMANFLLNMFQDGWAAIEAEYCVKRNNEMSNDMVLPNPESRRIAPPSTAPASPSRSLERSESMTRPVEYNSKSTNLSPQGGTPSPKKPEEKALEKRDMTFEEKRNLSLSLQTLTSDKLDGIVQIIKTRNPALVQQDDEIELDIESLDTETLWELDRFITSSMQPTEADYHAEHTQPTPPASEGPKVAEAVPSSSPVHGERQRNDASGSSSSSTSGSGSGSSSSGSDSNSSSG